MKSKIILVAIIIVGLGITYYFLYWYNYNEANDTMSLVMPKFMLAYAKQNNTAEEDPFVQAARIAQQELNARGNATTKDAPEPILYNSIPEGDIPPFPMEGQIEIEAFGIVQLSGECPDYTISNEI
jgi:hypothetical protein